MQLHASPTEWVTAATNVPLALISSNAALTLHRSRAVQPLRATIWICMFASLAIASALGVLAHGLAIEPPTLKRLWLGINGSLAISVVCFALGGILDGWGPLATGRALVPLSVLGAGFWTYASFVAASFLPFIVFEGLAMVFCLLIYASLTFRGQTPGAGWMTIGVLLTILAAVLQATRILTFVPGLPVDHNSVFHVVQCLALPMLLAGLARTHPPSRAPGLS